MTDSKDEMTIPAHFVEQPELAAQFVTEEMAAQNTDKSRQCYYAQCIKGCKGPKQSYAAANTLARQHMALYAGHTTGVLGPTYC